MKIEKWRKIALSLCIFMLHLILLYLLFYNQSFRQHAQSADFEMVKVANLLGYFKVLSYLCCLAYVRLHTEDRNYHTLLIIISTWVMGDIIDSVDGIVAEATNTASSFGAKMDHSVFDKFRNPFVWIVLATIYPEYATFWNLVLFRMFIIEDEEFITIPRIPILPFIDVAWYFPCTVGFRLVHSQNMLTRAFQLYMALIYITWGLDGSPAKSIRVDWYVQCYIFQSAERCELLTANNTTAKMSSII